MVAVTGLFGDQVSSYQVQLYDSQTPITVANFLNYANTNAYNGTIFHRDMTGYILQGGGYTLNVNSNNHVTGISPITANPAIQSEFDASRSNLRGTIAMALTSLSNGSANVNSATNQWFINLTDNSQPPYILTIKRRFTVFGHVVGEGMELIDAAAALPTYNLNSLYFPSDPQNGPFSDVPLAGNGSIFVTVLNTNVIPTVAWKGGNTSAPTDWGTLANWGSGSSVPDGKGVNVDIGSQDSANSVIDMVSAGRTVGNIYFTPFTSTTIQSSGGKSLTIDNNGKTATVNALGDQIISSSVVLNSNTIFSVSGTLNITGAISGAGKLGVTDIGTLTLSGTNTYTGNTIVGETGTLTAANTASLPGYNVSGRIKVNEGGTLALQVGTTPGQWTEDYINILKNNVSFDAGGLLGFDTTNGSFFYGSVIGGALGVAKLGDNNLTLTQANTFTGPVTFKGGALVATTLSNLGNGTALNFDGGALQFNGVFDPSVRTITFQAGGGTLDTQDKNIVLANSIGNGGSGSLTKQGSGMLTLSVSPNYMGTTFIDDGTLQLGSPGSGVTLPANTVVALTSSTAKLDLNGNSQHIVYLAGVAGSEIKLGGSTLTTGDYNTTDYSFDGSITSTSGGSLTKTGTGWLTLTGTNTYAGNTLVDQGFLVEAQAASLPGYNVQGKVTVSPGAVLIVKAGATTGEWAESEINALQSKAVIDSQAYLAIDTSDGDFSYGASGGTLGGSLNFAKLGNNTLLLTGSNTYSGNTEAAAGVLTAGKTASLPGYNAASMITVDPGATLAVRAGAATGEWAASDIGTLLTNVTFNTDSSSNTVSYFGIDTTGGNFSYSSAISGTQGLNKLGSNTLTLTGNNTFTGPVNFTNGLINATTLNNLGAGSELDFNGGGLQFNGVFDPSTRTMSFQADAIIDTQTNTITLAQSIGNGGDGGLTKAGTGTLVLTGSNNFNGAVNFNAGMIKAAALDNLGNGNELNFNGGGLQFNGVFDPSGSTITFLAGGAILDTQTNNIIMANSIGNGGDGGLTKRGSGMLTLSASPDYNGATVINAGTLQLASAATLPANTTVNLTASGAKLDANGISQTIASLSGVAGTEVKLGDSTLTTTDNTSTTFAGVMSGAGGTLTKTGSGTFTLTGSNTFTGAVNFNAGLINAASLSNLGNGTGLNFNGGGLQFAAAFDPSSRVMMFQTGWAVLDTLNNNVILANSIGHGGDGGLAKQGSGMLTLSASPFYKGGTNINAGTLQLASGVILPATTAVNLTASGAKLDINGNSQTIASLTGVAGTEVKLGAGTLTTGDNSITAFAGVISSASGGSLTKIGSGTFALTGSNTFSGAVNFNTGLINAASLSNLGNAAALKFNGGGLQFAAKFDPSSDNRTITFLAGGATFDTQANNITVGKGTFGNAGAGGLTKDGSGILELDSTVSYSGATTINAGTLIINNNQSTTLGDISGAGNLEVDGASTVLTVKSIKVNTFNLGAGTKVVIAAISGGHQSEELNIVPVSEPNALVLVPEPSALVLLGIGALAMLFAAQRKDNPQPKSLWQ